MQKKRQLAFWQPERYLALHQPVASFELPQPTRVAVNTSTSAFFLLTLPYLFIFIALFCAAFLDFSLLTSLQISLVGVLMLSVLIFLARYAQRRKPKWPYVEVHEDGIAAALDKIREPLPWQDICFFATYKGPPTPFAIDANKYTRYYELASHQRIIRWRHQPRLSPWMATRPALDQAAYDRWQQQLAGYIKERTGLPLVDLDTVPMPAKEQ